MKRILALAAMAGGVRLVVLPEAGEVMAAVARNVVVLRQARVEEEHATQVDPNAGWWFGLTDDELATIYPWEDWILARSLVGPIPEGDEERDLFAGVRESVSS